MAANRDIKKSGNYAYRKTEVDDIEFEDFSNP